MTVFAAEHLHVDDLAGLTVGNLQARVTDLACLFTEDRAQEALFGSEFSLALRRHLAHQNVARPNLGANPDDAAFVEVFEDVFAQVRDVTSDFFGTELRVAGIDFVFFNMNRSEHVVADQTLVEHDGIFEVMTLPRNERDEQVLAEGKFA